MCYRAAAGGPAATGDAVSHVQNGVGAGRPASDGCGRLGRLWVQSRTTKADCGRLAARRSLGGTFCVGEAGLLVEIRLDHVAHDRGGELAVLAVLENATTTISGARAGREADEPGVVLHVLALVALQKIVGSQLRGAGLAADLDVRKARADAGAALVDHAVSAIDYCL